MDKMMENGDMPSEETAGLEIYEWNSEHRQTLFYIPVSGPVKQYAFSTYPQPKWKKEFHERHCE